MRDEGTPSLDVRDVEDEYSRCQDGGYPDESRIGGFIHGGSCTYKSCARTLTATLIFPTAPRKRSIPVEVLAPARGQKNPRLFHAVAVFKTDQPAGNGVFPD